MRGSSLWFWAWGVRVEGFLGGGVRGLQDVGGVGFIRVLP